MSHILKQTLTISFLSAILFALNLFAFTEPSSPPPGSNTPVPLHVGATGQTKTGGLILNTGGASYGLIVDQGSVGIGTQSPTQKLDVIGYIRGATGLCIGGDCRTGWPVSGISSESDTLQSVTDRGNSTGRGISAGGVSGSGYLCIRKTNSELISLDTGTSGFRTAVFCPAGKVVTATSYRNCDQFGFPCMECSNLVLSTTCP